jgi:predicted O-linked N-acetylglucosamine transferase (SPINDLY family)
MVLSKPKFAGGTMPDPIQQALEAARGLVRQGKPREARQLYAVILKHLPGNAAARAELAAIDEAETRAAANEARLQAIVALHGQGRIREALDEAEAFARADPRSAVAANMIGVLSLNLGDREAAVEAFRRALSLDPGFAEVEANLGTLLTEMGRPREALPHLERALAARPGAGGILSSLANAQTALGARTESVALYRRAIVADPAFPHAYSNLGALLTQLGQFDEAEGMCTQALSLKPDFAEAWVNYGHLLAAMQRIGEAEAAFRRAIAVDPGQNAARTGLALLLAENGQPEAAADQYRAIADQDPVNSDHLARAIYADAMICRWDSFYETGLERLARADFGGDPTKAASPFLVLALIDDPASQRRAAEALVAKETGGMTAPAPFVSPRTRNGRIRVGYFSADFHGHATMYLMARLFEVHDRAAFEFHAFSFGPRDEHGMRDRMMQGVEHFHDVGVMSPEEIARHARALGIDIAVDLKGFTRDSRARIFLNRAAPIQVNYLGYPGTCGSDAWDYIIADRSIVPEEAEADYAERLVLLPDSYQVNDDRRAISPRAFTRAECSLPEQGFVFCCFNNSYKITPVEFDIWMRLLSAVDGSVLWLLGTSAAAERNLRQEAGRRGVDPARLVFAPRMQVPEHLARHRLADLFLDTFAVNAHTTASDALWAGLPVLAKPGRSFVARVSAGLVRAAGLPELVVETVADYEALALALARDPHRLAQLKARLRTSPAELPLFDTARYARKLETAYREMIAIHEAGEPPRHIRISP